MYAISFVGTSAAAAALGVSPSWIRAQFKREFLTDERSVARKGNPHSISLEEMMTLVIIKDLRNLDMDYDTMRTMLTQFANGATTVLSPLELFEITVRRNEVMAYARRLMAVAVRLEFQSDDIYYSAAQPSIQ
jgi:hypothetical protein